MLTPQTNSQTHWQRAISRVIHSICSISAFSALPAAPKRCRKECNKEQNCGKVEADVEPGSAFCGKLSYSAELECIQSPGDTNKVWISQHFVLGNQPLGFKSKWRSVKFSSVAYRRKVERTCEETRCCGHEPGSDFSRTCTETWRWKFGHQRRGRLEVAVYSNLRRQLKREPEDKMEDLNVSTVKWRTFMLGTQQASVHLGVQPKISHNGQCNNCSM